MDRAPTLTDVAAEAGVSRFTASLALRNSPRVPAPTLARVRAAADRIGYRPNPTLATLMRAIRQRKRAASRTMIAMILSDESPQWKGRHRYLHDMRRGAAERAEHLGYGFETLALPRASDPSRRLQQIIDARGIDGLVIAPLPHAGFRLDLDFSRLAYVAIGQTLTHVPAHRIKASTYHNMRTVLDAIRQRGWRRPGVILHQRLSVAVEDTLLGSYLGYAHAHFEGAAVPPLEGEDTELTPEGVVHWVRKNRVDAVIASRSEIADWLRAEGWRVGEDIAFAHLDCPSDSTVLAGMDQRLTEVGGMAVELIGEQIQANLRGIPRIPKIVEIDGVWHDGPTMPLRPAAEPEAKGVGRRKRKAS